MDRLDCPHCFSTVLVGPDGICPHCKKDTREAAPAQVRKIRVADGARLPSYCIDCDIATERRIKIAAANRENPDSWGNFFVRLLRGVGGALRDALKAQAPYISIKVVASQCAHCAGRRKLIEPFEVDFENRAMSILVCAPFYERICSSESRPHL